MTYILPKRKENDEFDTKKFEERSVLCDLFFDLEIELD